MHEQPVLTEKEWALVLDLLKRERKDVAVEIHHTTPGDRGELHEELKMIDGMIERLQGALVA